jgi:hypothetical protein
VGVVCEENESGNEGGSMSGSMSGMWETAVVGVMIIKPYNPPSLISDGGFSFLGEYHGQEAGF